jgi:hypothetical protein
MLSLRLTRSRGDSDGRNTLIAVREEELVMRQVVLTIVLALVLGLVVRVSSTSAAPGCKAFGQLIASEAQLADERPGVGEEAVAFAPANDDVAVFKTFTCT